MVVFLCFIHVAILAGKGVSVNEWKEGLKPIRGKNSVGELSGSDR